MAKYKHDAQHDAQDGTTAHATPHLQSITIQGLDFTIPRPYAEGHVVSVVEADTLNQTYAENIRNNFAKAVKTAKEAGEEHVAELQAKLDEYSSKYTFAGKSQRVATSIDPIAREAEKIAKGIILEQLKKKGLKVKDLPDGKVEALVASLLEKRPAIREEAEKRLNVARDFAIESLDDLESVD